MHYTVLLCLLLPFATAKAQTHLRVMEWNVENLFDVRHDTLKQDYDFMPDSERRWTGWRYWQKLNEVARTIMAVGQTGVPDIVGLCEVENDSVMHSLTRISALRGLGYEYIITSSPDERGIDCALLYQPLNFGLIEWHGVRVPSTEYGFKPTRDILYAKGIVGVSDTLHVIVCHAPSQQGGRKSARHRRLAMQTLQDIIDSIGNKHIVTMGDFNTDRPRVEHLQSAPPYLHRHDSVGGTYRFQGDWLQLDHIFTSPDIAVDTLRIARFPFLLEPNMTHGGVQPRRTYRGPSYHGGISDHLPIWTDVTVPRP